MIFRSAQLEIEGQAPLNFLESNDKGFLFHVFQLEGKNFKETGTGHIGSNGRSVYGPDAKNHWVQLPSSDYFKPLLPLVGCSYVAAHRVSAPSVDIQTAELLPHNAENLPVFLQTLRGNKPRAFRQIEEMVGKIFPDLISVNPATQANRVHITLSRKDVEQDIPLTHLYCRAAFTSCDPLPTEQ